MGEITYQRGDDMEEVNKYLTEAMGECWHEYMPNYSGVKCMVINYTCKKCVLSHQYFPEEKTNDFSTWQGFGKLWEWAIEQKWWYEFLILKYNNKLELYELNNPETFAKVIYEFLKDRK
jgi:hypothetical protein